MSMEAIISTFELTKEQVSSSEKLFLLACARRAGEEDECWPSLARLCADTSLDRKTVVSVRQSVINKGLMSYTGKFHGKSEQIPEMKLTYVNKKSYPHSEEDYKPSKSTSTKSGTGTSTENGTLNKSVELNNGINQGDIKELCNEIVDKQVWIDFIQHRKEIKKPLKMTGAKQIINKLKDFKNKGYCPEQCLKDSMANGWQGIFEPKIKQEFQNKPIEQSSKPYSPWGTTHHKVDQNEIKRGYTEWGPGHPSYDEQQRALRMMEEDRKKLELVRKEKPTTEFEIEKKSRESISKEIDTFEENLINSSKEEGVPWKLKEDKDPKEALREMARKLGKTPNY